MKTTKIYFLLILLMGWSSLGAQKLEKMWETEGFKVPESVLYEEVQDVIYVANIDGNSAEKDGAGSIALLNPDGTIRNPEWVTGLDAPKGMAITNGRLYVSDIDRLIEIDIESGRVVSRFFAPGAVFLNDVAACGDGSVFVSDSRGCKIYRLQNGSLTLWMEGAPFESPNGLFTQGGKLYVGDKNIYEVTLENKSVTMIIPDAGGVDGLEKNNQGEFVYSNWPGRIFIHRNGKSIKLLDTTKEEKKTADIDYALKRDLLLVPTFFSNSVVAYKIVD